MSDPRQNPTKEQLDRACDKIIQRVLRFKERCAPIGSTVVIDKAARTTTLIVRMLDILDNDWKKQPCAHVRKRSRPPPIEGGLLNVPDILVSNLRRTKDELQNQAADRIEQLQREVAELEARIDQLYQPTYGP